MRIESMFAAPQAPLIWKIPILLALLLITWWLFEVLPFTSNGIFGGRRDPIDDFDSAKEFSSEKNSDSADDSGNSLSPGRVDALA